MTDKIKVLRALQALQHGDKIPVLTLLGVPAVNVRSACSTLTTQDILSFLGPLHGVIPRNWRKDLVSVFGDDRSKPDTRLHFFCTKDLHWLDLPVVYDPKDWEFLWVWGDFLIPIPDLED